MQIAGLKTVFSDLGGYVVRISRDSSKIFVYYDEVQKNKEKKEYVFIVMDRDLNILWEKRIIEPYVEKKFIVYDLDVDNDGNVHALIKLYKEGTKQIKDGEINYSFRIFSYLKKGKEVKEYSIGMKEKFLVDMKIAINDDQDVICVGFYADISNYYTNYDGSFFMAIDRDTREIKAKNFKEFDLDFFKSNLSAKGKQKANKKADKGENLAFSNYDLKNIVFRDDGGVVLIAELSFVTYLTYKDGTTTTIYHKGSIIVVNINSKGNIEWNKSINKMQKSYNMDWYTSYALAVVNDKLYFVFYDNIKNKHANPNQKVYDINNVSKEGTIAVVSFDAEGNEKWEFHAVGNDKLYAMVTNSSFQLNNKLIMFTRRQKKSGTLQITFAE